MKYTVVLVALFMVGCAPIATMEELEMQAALTGDWTEVQKREAQIARRQARRGIQCPSGQVSFCETFAAKARCACVSRDVMLDAFAGL